MACKFCEALDIWKHCNEVYNKHLPKEEKLKEEYTVALVYIHGRQVGASGAQAERWIIGIRDWDIN